MKNQNNYLFIAVLVMLLAGCKKGYVTPFHNTAPTATNVAAIANINDGNVAGATVKLYVNDLQLNTGLTSSNQLGLKPFQLFNLPVVNGQTFSLKVRSAPLGGTDLTLRLDTNLKVADKGLDAFLMYPDKTNANKFHIYTVHTVPQPPPAKGKARIRIVNALPDLPGDGAVRITFSRKQNIPVNNGDPLAFGQETPYFEVPYGVYQPLLTDAAGKPILSYHNDASFYQFQNIFLWQQLQLEPGGIYTLMISKDFNPSYYSGGGGYLLPTKLILESLVQQEAFGKIKFVHVDSELDDVRIKVDQQETDEALLSFGGDKKFLTLNEGLHTIQLFDGSGRMVVEKPLTIINRDRQIGFIVKNKQGMPDLQFFDLPKNIDNDYTQGEFFNFSPDAPPATFLSERDPTSATIFVPGLNTLITNDSLTTNLPYLWQPRLSGTQLDPTATTAVPGFGTFKSAGFGGRQPPRIKVAFNVRNGVVNPSDVINSATIDLPFYEYPAFAEKPAGNHNDGDLGFFLIMLTGKRYNAPAGRGLKIRVIKCIE